MDNLYLWPESLENHNDGMHIGGCSIKELVIEHGTPLYLFDEATLRSQARQFVAGFSTYSGGGSPHYACKALLNVAIAQLLDQEGMSFDVVSLNELAIVIHAGVDPARCHFHGNGTPSAELRQAVEWGVGRIIVDNQNQLDTLISITTELGIRQSILLRVAPDVTAGGHEKIQTGKSTSKFGFNILGGKALQAIGQAEEVSSLDLCGLHMHAGSQIRGFESLRDGITRLFMLADEALQAYGWQLRELCPGGGLAVPINSTQAAVAISDYCAAIVGSVEKEASKRNWPLPHLSVEPGRSVAARPAVAVYTVTGSKPQENSADFLHIDGGIGDNLRPAMYGAVYEAALANRPNASRDTAYQISGRYCESGDILIPEVMLNSAEPGDLIALPAAGAYTLAMSSNYNGIGRPAVLLLADGQARIIQRRETWQDIVSRDVSLELE